MKLLDVITDAGVFVLKVDPADFPREDGNPPADSEIFIRAKVQVYSETEFIGWIPYQNTTIDPPSIVSVGKDTRITGFRLYEFNPVGVDGFITEATPTPATPYPFTCFGEYLGNKLKITGVAFKTPTTEYLLPVYVNDQAATDYMKPAALSQQIQLCKETDGLAPTEYLVIIPDVWLDFPVAAEYLTDYAKEAEPTTKIDGTGKAKAWEGWGEK